MPFMNTTENGAAAGRAAGKGYTVPRNRKRDYLTTEERERRAERAMVAPSELAFRAEQAAQRARLAHENTCKNANLYAAAHAKVTRCYGAMIEHGVVINVCIIDRERVAPATAGSVRTVR